MKKENFNSITKNEHDAISDICVELEKAKQKHKWATDIELFRMVAILSEEAGEVAEAAIDLSDNKTVIEHLYVELRQTAAMCIRILGNLQDRKDLPVIGQSKIDQIAIKYHNSLVMWLSRLKNSITAHPDYTGEENAEWTDFVRGAEGLLNEIREEVKNG